MFINKRLYIAVIIIVFCFLAGYVSIFLFTVAQFLLLALVLLTVYDYMLLYRKKSVITCSRVCSDLFSNGDPNEVKLHLSSSYPFPVSLKIIDEVPVIFQQRDLSFDLDLKKEESKVLIYSLRPVKRGVYSFGLVNIFVSTRLGLLSRKFKTAKPWNVRVYPSYICLHKYELLAISNRLTTPGLKSVRKIGQQLEPDQIRDYVKDDDYRTINWKATARKNKLMVNVFREERAQNVCIAIDKGRPMQETFEKMTLLDYSINSALALAYVAMLKGDKAGLITFEKRMDAIVPASRQSRQIQKISESLYKQATTFAESDFSALYQAVDMNVKARSLMIIYTNFDTMAAMQRQIRYFGMLAKRHTLVVVFFENTKLKELTDIAPHDKEDAYQKVVAEKISYEKSLIVSKLRQANVISILTHPNELTVNVVNKYLEIKARGINY